MIGTSDQSCWLTEACKRLLLTFPSAAIALLGICSDPISFERLLLTATACAVLQVEKPSSTSTVL